MVQLLAIQCVLIASRLVIPDSTGIGMPVLYVSSFVIFGAAILKGINDN